VTRNPNVQSLSDLSFSAIALIAGSEAVSHVDYTLPSARLVGVESYLAAYQALESGAAIAAAGDVTVLTGWVQEYPDYRLLPELLTAEPLAIALPKGTQYSELRRFINASITQWQAEGWLEDQATYWGLP
jgi:polar amino acid transport system substrate-binding protein